MSPYLSAVVPAYNEAGNLRFCVQTLIEQLSEAASPEKADCRGLEIIIVNDASQDGTGPLAESLAKDYPGVRAIHHLHNLGIGGAFCTGAAQACGEWVILIPADLALHPSELQRYLEAAPGADIVVGLRSDRSDYTTLRRVVSWVNIHLIQLLFGMREQQFQYISMYRRSVLNQIKIEYWRSAFFLAEILIKAKQHGSRLVQVEIRYAPRLAGKPTGARLLLIVKTVRDILHFWLRWLWLGPGKASGVYPTKYDRNNG